MMVLMKYKKSLEDGGEDVNRCLLRQARCVGGYPPPTTAERCLGQAPPDTLSMTAVERRYVRHRRL